LLSCVVILIAISHHAHWEWYFRCPLSSWAAANWVLTAYDRSGRFFLF